VKVVVEDTSELIIYIGWRLLQDMKMLSLGDQLVTLKLIGQESNSFRSSHCHSYMRNSRGGTVQVIYRITFTNRKQVVGMGSIVCSREAKAKQARADVMVCINVWRVYRDRAGAKCER
jgi:hypothetical protein